MEKESKPSKRYLEFEQDTTLTFLGMGLKLTHIFQQMEALALKVQKLEAAYYHAFPDRMDKDAQFEEQLRALNSPSEPETPTKSS